VTNLRDQADYEARASELRAEAENICKSLSAAGKEVPAFVGPSQQEDLIGHIDAMEAHVGKLRVAVRLPSSAVPKEPPMEQTESATGKVLLNPYSPTRIAATLAATERRIAVCKAWLVERGYEDADLPKAHFYGHESDPVLKCTALDSLSCKLEDMCRSNGASLHELVAEWSKLSGVEQKGAEHMDTKKPESRKLTATEKCLAAKGNPQPAKAPEPNYSGATARVMDARKKERAQ
jgi:hypothetical protein